MLELEPPVTGICLKSFIDTRPDDECMSLIRSVKSNGVNHIACEINMKKIKF